MPQPTDIQARTSLAAVVLADSFTQMFRPITLESPKVLLPLVNIPMIEYTLEWLAMNGVKDAFVFCCAHADKVRRYTQESRWAAHPSMAVHTICATNCMSAGDAMRVMYQKDVIKHDFVLVSADTVCNFDLSKALQEHRDRRAKDKGCMLTLVLKMGTSLKERIRLGDQELMVWLDPDTQRVWKYCGRIPERLHGASCISADNMVVAADAMDTGVAVCAPEVLQMFSDDFDYRTLRGDLVPGVLAEQELGTTIHGHLLGASQYAARIHNLRSYAAISADIMRGWLHPFKPVDNLLSPLGGGRTTYAYLNRPLPHHAVEEGVRVDSQAVVLEGYTVIGRGTSLGLRSRISDSVIGRNCEIGEGAQVLGSFLMDGVKVRAGAVLRSALVCDGAVVGEGARLGEGCVLAHRVVIGAGQRVAAHSAFSRTQQKVDEVDSDDDVEHPATDDSDDEDTDTDGTPPSSSGGLTPGTSSALLGRTESAAAWRDTEDGGEFDPAVVGAGGRGYLWAPAGGLDLDLFSLAEPLEGDILTGALPTWGWATKSDALDTATAAASAVAREVDWGEDGAVQVEEARFRQEVAECFLRCEQMRRTYSRFDDDNLKTELRTTKSLENGSFLDITRHLLITILALPLPPTPAVSSEYRALFASGPPEPTKAGRAKLFTAAKALLDTWSQLLTSFMQSEDDNEVELVVTLEEWVGGEGPYKGEGGGAYAEVFPHLLKALYDSEVVGGDALLEWADLKEADLRDLREAVGAGQDPQVQREKEAHARLLYDKCKDLIEWLREDEDEDEDEGG